MIPFARVAVVFLAVCAFGEDWPQFHGPAGSGVAPDTAKPPVEFGLEKNLAWKIRVGQGHGSPVVWGNRAFLLASDESNHATATPAVDANACTCTSLVRRSGVHTRRRGHLEEPLPIPKTAHGSGGSPVLAGDLVVLTRDQAPGAEVLALSKKDGSLVWRAPLKERRPGQQAAHSSPVIWKDQALIHSVGELVVLSLKDGSRVWWVSAYTGGISTPVVAGNIVCFNAYGLATRMGTERSAKTSSLTTCTSSAWS